MGVGVDYATGIRDTGDTVLSGLFGESSVAVVDFETLHATHGWVGSPATLSARNVLTHLMTDRTTYDLQQRAFARDGVPAVVPGSGPWTAPASPSTVGGTVFLGGGTLGADVIGDVVTAAQAVSSAKTATLVVLGGGAGSSTLANSYAQAVKKAGWSGSVTTVVHGSKGWSNKSLTGATAVVLVGDAPAALASTMADPAFRDAVTAAVRTTPVVLADGAMTAVLGSRWSAKANAPDSDLARDRGRGRRRLPCRRRRVADRARAGVGDARAAPHRRLPLGPAVRRGRGRTRAARRRRGRGIGRGARPVGCVRRRALGRRRRRSTGQLLDRRERCPRCQRRRPRRLR